MLREIGCVKFQFSNERGVRSGGERADEKERILRLENIISFSSNRSSFNIEIELGYKLPIAK